MKIILVASDQADVAVCNLCQTDVMASIDKRMMIKTLKQFLQPYVGAKADNFDVSDNVLIHFYYFSIVIFHILSILCFIAWFNTLHSNNESR